MCTPAVSAECYCRLCSLFAKVSYYNSAVNCYITRFSLAKSPRHRDYSEVLSGRICKAIDTIKSGIILRLQNSQVMV